MVVYVILAAVVVRSWLHWHSPYVPGMNGAYYLIQARALLEKGHLGVPDLPLTFMLQAGVARGLMLLGLGQERAIVSAVKLCDGCLPPLAAWPVWWLAREWCRRLGRDERLALLPAGLVTLTAPPLRMVGDFQKNSLALVWFALLLVTLRGWLARPGARRGLAALNSLALVCATHIGVFGAALAYTAAVLTAEARVVRDGDWRRRLAWPLAAALVVVTVGLIVLVEFDPQRIHRLLTALTRPLAFLGEPRKGDPGPPHSLLGELFNPVHWLACLAFAAAAIPAARAAWRRRETLPAADVSLLLGLAAATLLMTGPWITGDKLGRFSLIAFLPAVLLGTFAVLDVDAAGRRLKLARVAGVVGLLTGLPVVCVPPGPRAGAEAVVELQRARPVVTDPAHTLVVAAHGTEWWAAWVLHTQVAQPTAVTPALWQRYREVLLLQNDAAGPGGPGGPPPPPPPPGDRSWFGRHFGPPPPPPDGQDFRPRGGPMEMPALPADAPVVYRGEWLTLVRPLRPILPT